MLNLEIKSENNLYMYSYFFIFWKTDIIGVILEKTADLPSFCLEASLFGLLSSL